VTTTADRAATTTDRPGSAGGDEAAAGRLVAVDAYDQGMAVTRRTILVVEDEEAIVRPLTAALERDGFAVEVAGTAARAIELGRTITPDLVLLDLMLPDGSGFDVCRELTRSGDLPVIMLTARSDEADRIVGLELGADDYIVKPFSAREVIARIRAVLRRAAPRPAGDDDGPLDIGGLRLDPERRQVELDGEQLELARKEFELLERLMRAAGTVVTRQQLIEDVWDMNWFGSTKTLDVHISSLRKKLGDDPARPRFIHTVRGVGFRLATASELNAG
jgi:two-component system response regulator RegX3